MLNLFIYQYNILYSNNAFTEEDFTYIVFYMVIIKGGYIGSREVLNHGTYFRW